MLIRKAFYLSFCLLSLSIFSSVNAANSKNQTQLYDSLQCLDATRKVETEYNIPPHILSAIALTESGRNNNITPNNKVHTPWPWTANIRGKGKFFKTRQEALASFKGLLARGEKMFDVGCMQVNWHYHGDAFSSLEEAIDPYNNVRYAAEFLISLYEKTGSWPKAVERYHSATPTYFRVYRRKVASNWNKARDLMSPVDGQLNHYFMKNQIAEIRKEKSDLVKISKLDSQRIARMREIAKLRARVREYALNNY